MTQCICFNAPHYKTICKACAPIRAKDIAAAIPSLSIADLRALEDMMQLARIKLQNAHRDALAVAGV